MIENDLISLYVSQRQEMKNIVCFLEAKEMFNTIDFVRRQVTELSDITLN